MEGSPMEWCQAFADLVSRGHHLQPSELSATLNTVMRPLGIDVTVYLADYEQRDLRALPEPHKPTPQPLPMGSTLPGKSFMGVEILPSSGTPAHLWVPVLDGTHRLGVLDVRLPAHLDRHDPAVWDHLRTLAGLVGHLLVTKNAYGDSIEQARRFEPMSTEAEMLWRMLPPLTFATGHLALGAALEPCYEIGGDGFDYAVDDNTARVAVFDAVGHGLRAGLTCAITLAATRAARRDGQGLVAMARAADDAIASQFEDYRFVTAVLAELDLDTGELHYINAGHPPPMLLRRGKAVASLAAGRRLPLGLRDPVHEVAALYLEPGDRLLFFSDGVTEARDSDGNEFGLGRLLDLAERHVAARLPVAETLRRLSHAVLEHQRGVLQDDATLLLVEWARDNHDRNVP